jgi:hypothetical protein
MGFRNVLVVNRANKRGNTLILTTLVFIISVITLGVSNTGSTYADPVFRDSASANNSTGSTSLAIKVPSGTQSGDVMVAHVVVQTSGNSIAAPTGWHMIKRQDTSNNLATATYYKVAGSSEPSSYTWNFGTSGEASGGIASYNGVDTTSPIDANDAQYNNGTTNLDNAGLTTTVDNDLLIYAAGIVNPSTSVTQPTGFTQKWKANSSTATSSVFAQEAFTTAGNTGTIHGTLGSNYSNATQLIALRPSGIYATPPSGISLSSSSADTNGSGSTSLTINKPSKTQSGDVLVAHVVAQTAGNSVAAPTGWQIIKRQDTSSSLATATYYKVAGSSEPSSYTWTFGTSGEASGTIGDYVGVNTTTPIDTSNTQYNNGVSTVDNTGVTTTYANDMLVDAVGIIRAASVQAPTGFTEGAFSASNANTASQLFDETDTSTGATGTIHTTMPIGTYSTVTQLIALIPASATPPTPPSGISLRSSSANTSGGSSSSLVLNVPAGTQSGDVMVAHVVVRTAGNTITVPTGWTQIVRQDTGSALSTVAYYKIAGSSEPSSYTWTFGTAGEASGGIGSYIGVNNTTPIDTSHGQLNASSNNVDNTGVTTTEANDMLVYAAGVVEATSVNPPSGFTESSSSASNSLTTSEVSGKIDSSTGATGTIHGTENGGSSYSNTTLLIALKPMNNADNLPVTHVCGTLTSNQTWISGNVYVVDCELTIPDGKTLTINPGTIVKISASTGIDVQSGGTLNVSGNSTNHVIFTSYKDDSFGGDSNGDSAATTPASGDYEIAIQNENGGTSNVALADIRYGSYSFFANCGGSTDSNINLTDNQLHSSVQFYLCPMQTGTYAMKRNHFDMIQPANYSLYPLYAYNSDPSVIQLSGTDKNTFSGSGESNMIDLYCNAVAAGNTWTVDAGPVLWVNTGCGQNGGLNIDGTVNLNPGVIVKTSNAAIDVQSNGTLNVSGSSSNPVIFTSYKDDSFGGDSNGDGSATTPAAGDYSNAILNESGGTANVTFADIRNGTYAFQANCGGNIDSNITLTDNQIENQVQLSYCPKQSGSYAIKRNHFDFAAPPNSSGLYPINIYSSDPSVIQLSGTDKNTFTGTGVGDTIALGENNASCDTIAAGETWTVDSGPVLLLNDNCGLSDGTLNITGTVNFNPGVIVKTNGNYGLFIKDGGTLNVAGSSSNSVVFTSYKDDSAGGDTNDDGTTTTAGVNDYTSVIVVAYGTTNASISVNHANFRYGSWPLTLDAGESDIENTNISYSDVGMSIGGDAEVNIEGTNTSHLDTGISLADRAKVIYRGSFSNISGKAITACNWDAVDSGCTVDAAYVNWGSADGPLASNPSDVMACGAVTFSPWKYGTSTYTMTDNPDVYSVPNCDNSDTPSDQLASAISGFQSAVGQKENLCSLGDTDACNAVDTAYACLSGAMDVAQSTSPWPLPSTLTAESTAEEVNAWGGQFRAAAVTWVTDREEVSISGFGFGIANDLINLTGTFITVANAYNSCAP